MEKLICPVCASSAEPFLEDLFDDRYGFSGVFSLFRCSKCRHSFLRHDFAPEQLISLYSNYYPRSEFKLSDYQPSKEKSGFWAWLNGEKSSAFRWVPRGVRVLDVGCGFGESLGYHAARGCEVYGVEADENIRRVADAFSYNVHVGLFDPEVYEPDFFDFVTMDQVIEHVTDPLETLQGVAKILKQGGKAILATPNADGWGARFFGRKWINWHVPYHLQFYSKESMQILAEKVGLQVELARTITASAWLYYQWLHLLSYPKPSQPSSFWAVSALGNRSRLGFSMRLCMRFLALLNRSKLHYPITRFFDALGLGDNLIFVLKKA